VGFFASEISEPSDVDDSYFKQLSEEKKLRQSIIENLTMILQTRRGSVLHLSDFGIPDIVQVYIDSGYSFEQLKKYISETILKYEPRVEKVKVEEPKFDKDNFHIFLKIKAVIKDLAGTEILLTEFSTTGWTKVVTEREK
jgi:type VI secretion system protein